MRRAALAPVLVVPLVVALAAAGCAGPDQPLVDHLAQVEEAGESACAELDWLATARAVAALPHHDFVVTLAHDEGLAACGFGLHTPDDPGDASGDTPPAAVVVVADAVPDLDTFDAVTVGGREVHYVHTSLTDLGLDADVEATIKILPVESHALIAAVTAGHTTEVSAGELLDAAASDLGL